MINACGSERLGEDECLLDRDNAVALALKRNRWWRSRIDMTDRRQDFVTLREFGGWTTNVSIHSGSEVAPIASRTIEQRHTPSDRRD